MTPQVIFNGNSVDSKYVGRVSVDVDQNLSLHKVQINESGWYICVRDGSFHHITLDVNGQCYSWYILTLCLALTNLLGIQYNQAKNDYFIYLFLFIY